ncbi:MAG TPA: Stk1 family PASTA domain-containing Ser/Thr kinase [Candidatus Blautia faecigallinarum]|uniref:non-specific serine/threonine protein kinase n=1 Tax=Candidatus Blautia faecigallinarum TaxID=2838488 RepID=A0A9D2DQL7_9FIRM|nr:Stk1 family PASTA domain-containing Ser/Thr kinase [Candidatus Blautia faecigallinarum]
MLKTGMIIAERYEILAKIGTGGMADVYKAKDHKLNRFVAVKVLKAEFREDTTFVQKFRREAQAAAGLTHPNIVNVFDVGDDDGVHYIVMELIEGITLKEYIAKKGKLSIKEATSIAIQVSMGLEAAHSHGIVHRDVKPQNIIIATDGKVKVTDFGIARAASSNTISSNVMGSVHYSSPEQVRGGYSDEKSDIYSLGITMYEMVTGRVPFDGDTTVAIAIKHLQEEMVPPSIYTEDLPYSLEQIIYKCTQKSPDRRYGKMEEVIADLKHSLIDPQGDFVKISSVNHDAKTVVISDEELGEIKHTQKQGGRASASDYKKDERAGRSYDKDYDDDTDEEDSYRRRAKEKQKRGSRKVPKGRSDTGRAITIFALLAGAVLLVAVIFFIIKNTGLLDGNTNQDQQQQTQEEENTLVTVPDFVGKTEAEAEEMASAENLGIQMIGEEPSTQEKGRVSYQDIQPGTQVEQHTTVKYRISAGAQEVTMPEVDQRTGIEAQQMLEDMGLTVEVQKEYSELDVTGYAMVNPGYAYYTIPEAGDTVTTGETVTLVVSRGVNYGSSAEVPSVVGMSENDAITTLGKWLDIEVVEEQNASVAAGEVFAQSPEGYTYANPDEPITITVSTGNTAPTPEAAETTEAADTAQEQAVAAGEVWKCTQSLNTPVGYNGGLVRMELLQDVGGEPTVTMIADEQQVQFPYKLDITGAPGVAEGTIVLYEKIDNQYQKLGNYTITFEKAE